VERKEDEFGLKLERVGSFRFVIPTCGFSTGIFACLEISTRAIIISFKLTRRLNLSSSNSIRRIQLS
jgi:hypothetical protein